MKLEVLIEKCNEFEKQATVARPRSQDQLLLALNNQLQRAANFLPSKYNAQLIFNHIRSIKNGTIPNRDEALQKDPYFKEAQRILIQLEYFEQNLPNIPQLTGIKANAIPTLKNNLKILMDGTNFAGYQQYTFLKANQPKMIDLDEWSESQKAKKDFGF